MKTWELNKITKPKEEELDIEADAMWTLIKTQADDGDPSAQRILKRYKEITDVPHLQKRLLLFSGKILSDHGTKVDQKTLIDKAAEYGVQNVIIDEMALELLGASHLFKSKIVREHTHEDKVRVDEQAEKEWEALDKAIMKGDKAALDIMNVILKISADPVIAKRLLLAMHVTIYRFGEDATGLQLLYVSEACLVEDVIIKEFRKYQQGGGSRIFDEFKLKPR